MSCFFPVSLNHEKDVFDFWAAGWTEHEIWSGHIFYKLLTLADKVINILVK